MDFRYIVEVILVDSNHLPCIKAFNRKDNAIYFIDVTNEGKANHYDIRTREVNSNLNKDVILCYDLYDKETNKHYATIMLRDLKELI